MKDNDLIRLFLPIINQGLVTDGYTGVTVKQSQQPTIQGANSNPAVFFYKLFDKRFGWVRQQDNWDEDLQTMVHSEIQYYETTFQIGAMVMQNPQTPYQYTASDLINEVAAILQSQSTIETFADNNVGILRVSEIRNPYFKDDYDKFEAFPSFDFTLTHRQTRISSNPVIESVNYGIYGI